MPNAYQQYLLDQVDRVKALERFLATPFEPGDATRFHGLSAGARALVLARISQRLGRPLLVVTPDAESAEAWHDDFEHFGLAALHHFPMAETLPYEAEEPILDILSHQYSALYFLARGERADATVAPAPSAASSPPVIVVPVEALQRRVPSPEAMRDLAPSFVWGERLDPEAVAARLVDMGYDRESMVEARGEFTIRGHIVDIFPPQLDNPIRIDLFGDEIESIRYFDAGTQRSLQPRTELERVTILPASSNAVCERLAREEKHPLVTLMDWMPPDTFVVLDNPERYDTHLDRLDVLTEKAFNEQAAPGADGALLPPATLYAGRPEIRRRIDAFSQIVLPPLNVQTGETSEPAVFDFVATSFESMPTDPEAYLALIRKKQLQDFSVHVVCDNDGQVTRLEELLREHEITTRVIPASSEAADYFRPHDLLEGYQEVCLLTGPLHTGFIFPEALLLCITDREIFGRYKRRHVYRKAYKGRPIASADEIRQGDYVVHIDHGVGRFIGIRRQEIDGRMAELVELQYAEGNKLLVPIENVGRIQKFSSPDGATPTLDRMGSNRWIKRRKKSQEKIEQMAEELLAIYAERQIASGYTFSPDTTWMREFEDSFLHQETPDQLRAIEEVKNDMISPRSMDRLLCGDVGFGKTEVAMRAAFKAVEEKKQVAVLVPTTILAQQHYGTFRERFAGYPFTIEVVSRFRTAAEQSDIARRCRNGEVDILIGTHRLLSTDMKFADLGLLIIDEEHRFGVRQKEKIKSLRASVDILTLSATPIPRTLYMALSGIRDMSAIHTPPRDRLPIRTRVIHFTAEEIEQAVLRELNRGGQIYFVHNRVQNIDRVAGRLREIVPQARIAVGHGQMSERELETVMIDFIDRKYDILLATTIIESGLDIPNVNTIIINRADAFGLAQLYQLRGRVGRDVKRAYAYLIIPDGKPITDTAVKRLRAIEEFTELGSGFQVAMRDLEIRGTGNLLGSEQHGAIEAVGFDLYCQMLEEAVHRLQGKRPAYDYPVEVRWPVAALLPAEYVPVEAQRVAFYKRCATARTVADLNDLAEELRDRFGALPREASNLIAVSQLRVLGREAGVERIAATPTGLRITPRGDFMDSFREMVRFKDNPDWREVCDVGADHAAGRASVVLSLKPWRPAKGLDLALRILAFLAGE